MKKILFLLALIISIASCKKEDPIEPTPPETAAPTGTSTPTAATKFFVGFEVSNNITLIDYPDVTINGTPLAYVAENFNTLNVNNGTIDRAFEYDIPSGLVNCNDSIDYNIVFNDADIVGVTIYDIQVFSSMTGTNVENLNVRWSGWTQWEEPTSVPYTVVKTDKIKYICN